jgi:hypothetical protein
VGDAGDVGDVDDAGDAGDTGDVEVLLVRKYIGKKIAKNKRIVMPDHLIY